MIGGPNGAGKTTIARDVLFDVLDVAEFVNADSIAAGLSGFEPERAAISAGRIMLARLRELAEREPPVRFAFESTLASRSFAPWIDKLISRGFEFHVLYAWLRSPELAIRRVRARVRSGGHSVPPDVVRRRYARSAVNFMTLYRPLAERAGTWRVFDNSRRELRVIAHGGTGTAPTIVDARVFAGLEEVAHGGAPSPDDDI